LIAAELNLSPIPAIPFTPPAFFWQFACAVDIPFHGVHLLPDGYAVVVVYRDALSLIRNVKEIDAVSGQFAGQAIKVHGG
jgi:hypothetical protein